ncbi:MAG: hypothetical protein A3D31_02965 [Candidatus Fluviicola riflensis]|nr:MAG: hypothetical protein A3D31_02965 [Candidatus Fluviicola riflensis]OGS85970.1 MAG: hypothetical protein A3E30_10450 [Fluviicola sp. RIFCSPHIGHO2_12_FULL_43_24]OGS86379.1 MAG: hypothetical protein A2724_02420 [Fluviicola sp. RIFCSPHIGHO2_01_FULL_43_53]
MNLSCIFRYVLSRQNGRLFTAFKIRKRCNHHFIVADIDCSRAVPMEENGNFVGFCVSSN